MSDLSTLSNVATCGGELNPSSVRLAPDTFPEAKSSKTGVSVRYVPDKNKSWYVFRASYGREDKAADFLINDGTYIYIAKKYVEGYVHGKRRRYLQTLIPSLLFAYTSEEKAEEYINNTPAISFLTYYYNHFKTVNGQKNPPLIIPNNEMNSFVKATINKNEHLLFVEPSQCHYKSGEMVKVIEGAFKGVVGKVARISGQQRVVISLSNIGLVSTAYIPTAFIQRLETE